MEESRGEGLLACRGVQLTDRALGFTEKSVGAVLMPLASLASVAPGASVADVEELCAATGYSRFPVSDEAGTPGGYLHIKDVLEYDETRRDEPFDLLDATLRHGPGERPAPGCARDLAASRCPPRASRGRSGRLLGLVTLEDVIEELVGEIRDAAHHGEPA
ncbi:MAG: CBS domain-containing protein [Nocardioides sp.]